jgi:hypothetical protein
MEQRAEEAANSERRSEFAVSTDVPRNEEILSSAAALSVTTPSRLARLKASLVLVGLPLFFGVVVALLYATGTIPVSSGTSFAMLYVAPQYLAGLQGCFLRDVRKGAISGALLGLFVTLGFCIGRIVESNGRDVPDLSALSFVVFAAAASAMSGGGIPYIVANMAERRRKRLREQARQERVNPSLHDEL